MSEDANANGIEKPRLAWHQMPVLQPTTLWVRTYPNHSLPKRGSGIGRGRRRTRRSVQFGGSCGTSSDLWSWRPRPGARAPLGRGLSVRLSVQHCPHRGPQKMQVSNLLRHSCHKNPSFPFSWSKAWLSSMFLSSGHPVRWNPKGRSQTGPGEVLSAPEARLLCGWHPPAPEFHPGSGGTHPRKTLDCQFLLLRVLWSCCFLVRHTLVVLGNAVVKQLLGSLKNDGWSLLLSSLSRLLVPPLGERGSSPCGMRKGLYMLGCANNR